MGTRGWGCDLVGELEKRNAASSHEDEPPEEIESPTKRLRLTPDDLPLIREYVRAAQFDATSHACIVVVVDDSFADKVVGDGDRDDAVALQAGQRCYFHTKVLLDGKPVWNASSRGCQQ